MSTIRKIYSSFQFEIKVLKKQFIFLTIITSIIAISTNVYYQQESQSMLDHHVLQLERQAGLLLSQDNLNKTKDDPMLTQIENDIATNLSKEYTAFKLKDDETLPNLISDKIILLKQYQNLYPNEYLDKLGINIENEILFSDTLNLLDEQNLSYEFNKSAVFPLASISFLKQSLIYVPLLSILLIVMMRQEEKNLYIYKNNPKIRNSARFIASQILLASVLVVYLLTQVTYHIVINPSIFSTSSLYLKYPLHINGEFIPAQNVLTTYILQYLIFAFISVSVLNLIMTVFSYRGKLRK